jgi:hypothetical protein
LGGSGTDAAVYCALVVGCTSVPGAKAYWRPPGSGSEGTSVVPVRSLAP